MEIITSEGPVNVEDLAVGTQVLTMDRGMQPVRRIGSRGAWKWHADERSGRFAAA